GGTARHRLDQDEAERLRPIDWKQERGGAGEERLLANLVHLADKLDLFAVELGFELLLEVGRFRAGYLGCDPKWHPDGACDAYGVFRPLLRREPSEFFGIAFALLPSPVQMALQQTASALRARRISTSSRKRWPQLKAVLGEHNEPRANCSQADAR
ncbi:hypothetical protein ABID65_009542, partial [Bradyrhizobium sp. S3.9.2]